MNAFGFSMILIERQWRSMIAVVLLYKTWVLRSVSRDAALAGMAVKVMQLESLLISRQADLQRMGDSGQAWVQEACCLRDAVTSTLAALG